MSNKAPSGICKICKNYTEKLIEGHIFPQWSSKLGSLGESRIANVKNERWEFEEKTGTPTEYMFCGECEHWLGSGEDEIKRTFLSPNSSRALTSAKIHINNFPIFEIHKSKITLVKRAIAGILLKAHLTESLHFQKIFLSKKKFKVVQQSLNENHPMVDNFDYMDLIFIKSYDFLNYMQGAGKGPISVQMSAFANGKFIFMFAGIVVYIDFNESKKLKTPTSSYDFFGLIADIKHLGFPDISFPNISLALDLINDPKEIIRFKNIIKNYSPQNDCPCGLSVTKNKSVYHTKRTFGDCCKIKFFSSL